VRSRPKAIAGNVGTRTADRTISRWTRTRSTRFTSTTSATRRSTSPSSGDRRTGASAAITNAANNSPTFDKPVDNIGDKSFSAPGGYAAYANQHIYSLNIPGCATPGKVFVGQRKESFYIAVGKIFDLFNLNPLGAEVGGNNNDLEGKNVSTLALELPISCVTTASDPVIGAFTTASVRQGRIVNGAPGTGLGNSSREGGAWTQVSRLGMPLVNEVVIGLEDKDKFNASLPKDDAAKFADYVTNPVLPALIESLFPAAKAPTNFADPVAVERSWTTHGLAATPVWNRTIRSPPSVVVTRAGVATPSTTGSLAAVPEAVTFETLTAGPAR